MSMKHKAIQFFTAIILVAACSSDRSGTCTIAGYNFDAVEQVSLEDHLQEISGLAYDTLQHVFLAINDEQGKIFVLDPITFIIKKEIHFAEKGDYEEIQVVDSLIYVLRSDGTIFKMKYDGKGVSDITTFDYKGMKAEYESFYIKPTDNTLILIPKNSKDTKINKATAGYVLDANNGTVISKENFSIEWHQLKNAATLHPSAVAVQPDTKELYVLASIEKILLVLDTSGIIRAEYELPFLTFQQPEGITFDQKGNMYISNEAGGYEPNIIKIPVK